jgi:hypothetical protein
MVEGMAKLEELAAQFSPEEAVSTGKWFGMPCLKVGGKVFAAWWQGDAVFKLAGEAHAEALALEGACLFDPRGKGHPMREWVQVPARAASTWGRFARAAAGYVAGIAPARKAELIDGLVEARRGLLDAVHALPAGRRDQVFLGTWSVRDLLAHLVGWDHTNREAAGAILAGREPAFRQHYDRDWATYNARLVADYRRDDWDEMLAAVEDSHRALVDYLQSLPAEAYVKTTKIGTLLAAEARDEEEHRRQIEAFAAGEA